MTIISKYKLRDLATKTENCLLFRYPEMKTVTNCFVLNLAISDILFALTIPVVAYTRISQSWKLGDTTCRIIPYLQVGLKYFGYRKRAFRFCNFYSMPKILLIKIEPSLKKFRTKRTGISIEALYNVIPKQLLCS